MTIQNICFLKWNYSSCWTIMYLSIEQSFHMINFDRIAPFSLNSRNIVPNVSSCINYILLNSLLSFQLILFFHLLFICSSSVWRFCISGPAPRMCISILILVSIFYFLNFIFTFIFSFIYLISIILFWIYSFC